MAGISQIIRWRQGRAVISHRSVQKARSGDAAASSSANAATAPQPSTQVSLTGSTQAAAPTYLDKLKRRAKTDARLQATRINAVNRETNSTRGPVPAADAGAATTMQQSLRDALSQFAAPAEPAAPPQPPPPRDSNAAAAPASPSPRIAVSWDVEATYEWDAQMQDAQHARKVEAETEASEAPSTPAST